MNVARARYEGARARVIGTPRSENKYEGKGILSEAWANGWEFMSTIVDYHLSNLQMAVYAAEAQHE
jgi:hypothetical protein